MISWKTGQKLYWVLGAPLFFISVSVGIIAIGLHLHLIKSGLIFLLVPMGFAGFIICSLLNHYEKKMAGYPHFDEEKKN